MDKDSFVIMQLPGFAAPASGTAQSSLAALRDAKTTSYFQDGNTLWVKLVVEDATPKGPVVVQVGRLRAQATIDVSRPAPIVTASLDEQGSRRQ
jgi:cell migration-inducing and hyaluronan-binding protein